MTETTALFLRIGLVAVIYLFLFQLLLALRRDTLAGAPAVPRLATLVVVEPAGTAFSPGEQVPIRSDTIVGRTADADLALLDQTVSGQHARVFRDGTEWFVEDLGSTNGTRVNGQAVREATALDEGDVVDFGRVRMRLEWRDDGR